MSKDCPQNMPQGMAHNLDTQRIPKPSSSSLLLRFRSHSFRSTRLCMHTANNNRITVYANIVYTNKRYSCTFVCIYLYIYIYSHLYLHMKHLYTYSRYACTHMCNYPYILYIYRVRVCYRKNKHCYITNFQT